MGSDNMMLRLAMLGMVEGNGHPYSWSAIINGRYDRVSMEECGYPVIPQYLGAQNPKALGIEGARVTHVWCEEGERALHVARACFIENVVERSLVIPPDHPMGRYHIIEARNADHVRVDGPRICEQSGRFFQQLEVAGEEAAGVNHVPRANFFTGGKEDSCAFVIELYFRGRRLQFRSRGNHCR